MFGAIILQIILIFLNAVFASAEIAVISTNETKLQKLAEKGDKRAARLNKLTAQPARFLSTIQVAITLAGLLGSAFAAENFAEPLVNALLRAGVPVSRGVLNSICVVLITLILAYFSLVFGELVPKRIAMKKAEKTALSISGILRFVSVIFAPIVWLLTVSTNGVLRLCGINPHESDEQATEEDIIMMAEAVSEQGLIDTEENEFIRNVLEFKELSVGEICTHRKDTDLLFVADADEEWQEKIFSTRHTYYPVCGKSVDDVVGVLSTKEYFRLSDKGRESVMKKAVSKPVYVAENTPANTLFYRMKTTREYFAIVVDEYGGMSGIITLHDILEELVGEINEKGEKEDYKILPVEDGVWEIVGLAPLAEVEETIGVTLSEEEKEEYETFGGYVCGVAGISPEDGTTFTMETDRLFVTVKQVSDRCIRKMVVRVLPQKEKTKE